ncbi:MAG: NAD(+) synthase [Prevotellaceae bacterium]|nr:NAD(+) synthase [Prevotellaceae bacterium]
MQHGFVRVAAAVPTVRVANVIYNVEQAERLLLQADGRGADVCVFPELSLTGYTCQDLFRQQLLIEEAETALVKLLDLSRNLAVIGVAGLPVLHRGAVYNCAAVIHRGKCLALVPKTYLPNYNEYYEQRWFASAALLEGRTENIRLCGQQIPLTPCGVFCAGGWNFGIELCEDLWAVVPPSCRLAAAGAEIILNLSASNEQVGKNAYLRSLVNGQSARTISGYVYAGAGWGESSQDLVYSGRAFVAENGQMLAEGERFAMKEQLVVSEIDVQRLRLERINNTTFRATTADRGAVEYLDIDTSADSGRVCDDSLHRCVDPHPFVPSGRALDERCEEILCIQSEGLARRIEHTGAETVVLGISGGLDSTLALLVCANAFDRIGRDRKGIVGITMPGFGTTDRTYTNAVNLMKGLGVTIREISIAAAVEGHLRDIGHDMSRHDVTYENSQARERTQILMDAANQMNGFVVGTGDLSELALGWATYNGDHMSMYGVNVSVPKTLVRHLVKWIADNVADAYSRATLLDIIDTPISPELIPAGEAGEIAQRTEDLVGPYALHDFFLYHTLRNGFRPSKVCYLALKAFKGVYTEDVVKHWIRIFYQRFFAQQFKRSCLPDGPKVGSVCLSPRGDFRMPSDASPADWLKEVETL